MSLTSFNATTFSKLQPKEYFRHFMAKSVRPDGRKLEESRAMSINNNPLQSAHGSATVKIGQTIVICGIKAEVAQPLPITPKKGFFVPNIDLPSVCSPKFQGGPPGQLTQSLSEEVNQLFLSVPIINLEDLCIEPGRAVWTLYADIVCLNYDGSVLDACLVALIAALLNTRLPKVNFVDGNTVAVGDQEIPLKIERVVASTSFCIFDGMILMDPTEMEESISTSQISITLDHGGNFCGISKLGGDSVDLQIMQKCAKLAAGRSETAISLLKVSLT